MNQAAAPNHEAITSAIDSSVTTTMEDMLFIEAEALEGPPNTEHDELWGRLDAQSPVACRITLQLDRALASRLASELHVTEPGENSDEILADTLGELLNTIAGAILGAVDESEEIEMGLPQTGEGQLDFAGELVQRRYELESEEMLVSVELS